MIRFTYNSCTWEHKFNVEKLEHQIIIWFSLLACCLCLLLQFACEIMIFSSTSTCVRHIKTQAKSANWKKIFHLFSFLIVAQWNHFWWWVHSSTSTRRWSEIRVDWSREKEKISQHCPCLVSYNDDEKQDQEQKISKSRRNYVFSPSSWFLMLQVSRSRCN